MHLIEVSVCFCSVILNATRQCSSQVDEEMVDKDVTKKIDNEMDGGGSVNGSGKNYLVILKNCSYLTKGA